MAIDGWQMSLNLLALETSGRSGSVALSRYDRTLEVLRGDSDLGGSITTQCLQLDRRWGSAKTLAPAIDELLVKSALQPRDLDAIAVVQGPGSFTGLRVGVATAKVMAYALGKPVLAVDTLDVIAEQVAGELDGSSGEMELFAVVDAFRGQCFWGSYRLFPGGWSKSHPTRIDDNATLAAEIVCRSQRERVIVAGSTTQKLQESYGEYYATARHDSEAPGRVVWEHCEPSAQTVANLGWRAWRADQTAEVFGLLPMYYRSSAAEEKHSI